MAAGAALAARSAPRAVVAEAAIYRPLGLLRTVLAGLVMLHHFGIHLMGPALAEPLRQMDFGRLAVLVFFVLSGFVVAEAAASFYAGRPFAFAANRLLRIAPPLLAAIVLSLAVQALLFRAGSLHPLEGEQVTAADLGWRGALGNALALLPGTRLFGQLPSYLPIRYIWTIRVELLFYLLVAGALVLLSQRSRLVRALPMAGGLLLCLYPLVRPDGGAFEFAGYFGCGVAFCLLLGWRRPSPAVLLLLGLSLAAAFRQLVQDAVPGFAGGSVVLLAGLLGLAAWLATCTGLPQRLRHSDRAIGALSYPLYLNHSLVGTLTASLWPEPSVARLVAACLAALLLAYAMDRAVEPLAAHLRQRIRGRALA